MKYYIRGTENQGSEREKSTSSRRKVWRSLWLGVALIVMPRLTWGTALEDAASVMLPGTWNVLVTTGLSVDTLKSGSSGSPVIGYADSAVWDPGTKQLLFLGAPHNEPWKFLIYQDSNNTWQTGPLPLSCMATQTGCIGHAYDHNAINPANGDVYHRPYNSRSVFRYRDGTWSAIPSIPTDIMTSLGITGGLQYFPELGGLVFIQGAGGGGAYFFNPTTGLWSKIASPLAMGEYHNFIEYNPVHKLMLFGGGNGGNQIYKLDATGKVTKMKDAPFSIGINSTLIAADPASGKFLVTQSNRQLWEYDVTTDTWTLQAGQTPVLLLPNTWQSAIAASVSTYGVIMYVAYNNQASATVYLYKHALSPAPDTMPPAAPQNPNFK